MTFSMREFVSSGMFVDMNAGADVCCRLKEDRAAAFVSTTDEAPFGSLNSCSHTVNNPEVCGLE